MPAFASPNRHWKHFQESFRRISCVLLSLGAFQAAGLPGLALAAAPVEIHYHKDVWPCDPKQGIQFVSPAEGWVGVYGVSSGQGKPNQAYLLMTSRGPADLHPVGGLGLPPDHALKSFFFLDRQHGWVVASAMKAGGGPTRLWRTEDGGKAWQELPHNLPPAGGRLQFVTARLGWLLGAGRLWRTEDGGTTWRRLSITPAEEEASLTGMFLLDSLNGWVTGKGLIHQTADGGETWTRRYDLTSQGRPSLWFLQFPSPNEGWVAAEGIPLARTLDGGQTWRPVRVRHLRMGPFDRFTSLHFLSPQVGVLAGQHHEKETVPRAVRRSLSPVAMGYYRPYLLVTFDGGRSWSYYDLPIPVGEWSKAGPNILFGVNTVDSTREATGIVEVRFTPPKEKPPKR
jgi:photosystem II stability/assembly factor-like uncharacterized protein